MTVNSPEPTHLPYWLRRLWPLYCFLTIAATFGYALYDPSRSMATRSATWTSPISCARTTGRARQRLLAPDVPRFARRRPCRSFTPPPTTSCMPTTW